MKANREFYKILQRASFFENYTAKELRTLSQFFVWSSYIEGEVIYKEGEAGHEMAVMLYGEAKVSALDNDQRIDLALLKEGDIFGETGVIIEQPRFATVIAYTNCELATISSQALQLLNQKEKGIAVKFLYQVAEILAGRFKDAKTDVKKYLTKSMRTD